MGTLVGIGTCLIAIKGRHGAEEVLLNFAGMFAFAVALVPTPLDAEMCTDEPYCLDVPERVGNNMGSLLVVGGLVMLLSTWPRRRDLGSRAGWDLWLTWLTWAATGDLASGVAGELPGGGALHGGHPAVYLPRRRRLDQRHGPGHHGPGARTAARHVGRGVPGLVPVDRGS